MFRFLLVIGELHSKGSIYSIFCKGKILNEKLSVILNKGDDALILLQSVHLTILKNTNFCRGKKGLDSSIWLIFELGLALMIKISYF